MIRVRGGEMKQETYYCDNPECKSQGAIVPRPLIFDVRVTKNIKFVGNLEYDMITPDRIYEKGKSHLCQDCQKELIIKWADKIRGAK